MGKIVLITGGVRSGKSKYAETLAKACGDSVLYIATATASDDEMIKRIEKHRESRPATWETHEGYRDVADILKKSSKGFDGILIDCITVMVSNLLLESINFDVDNFSTEEAQVAEEKINGHIKELVNACSTIDKPIFMVTNEVGMSVVPPSKLGRVFADIAGRVNQFLAAHANEVYMTVCGIPIKLR